MDSAPPLNLSTSVKVKDSLAQPESNVPLPVKSELIQHPDCNQFVLLEHLSNEVEGVVITGEVNDNFQVEKSSCLTNKDEATDGNENSQGYVCSHCSEKFIRANQLRSHEKTHHEEKVRTCDQCLETFPRLSLLLRHKQEHTKRTYECPDCDVPLNSYASFRQHMKTHKGEKKFKCSDCSMTFIQQSHLITHKRKHTGEKPFSCPHCHTKFKQVSHLTTHLRTHTKDKPYTCDICNASFSQTGSLKRHRRSHTGEKPFKCKKCEAVFVEKRNLQRHLLSHSGIRPFKCDLCSASFTQYIDLKRHKQSHSGLKPYKCDVCEAAFSRKNNLKWHKLTHEGETPHICDICNVGFRIGRDLKQHKRSHLEAKPYSCEYCKASFLHLATLKRHASVHSGFKPFSCELCHAKFFERNALKRHIQRHDPIKPYCCTHCGSTFLNASTLRRHKFVVHNDARYENEIAKSTTFAKHSDSLEPTATVEEENSLHICESSYQRSVTAPEQNMVEGNVQSLNRDIPQAIGQVVNETNLENGTQISTFLVAQPGQPPRTGRPAENCPNTATHYHIYESTLGQWQTWCFCETPNIRNSEISNVNSEIQSVEGSIEPVNSHSEVDLNYNPIPQTLCNPILNIQAPVNNHPNATESVEQQHQHISIERSQNTKTHCVSANTFHSAAATTHLNDFSTSNSYQQVGNQVNSYPTGLPITQRDHQIHHTSTESTHSISNTAEKKTVGSDKNYISVPVSSQLESEYSLHERTPESISKGSETINFHTKDVLSVPFKSEKVNNVCEKSNEIIAPFEGNKITQNFEAKQPKEVHNYQNSHTPSSITSEQENFLKEPLKLQTYCSDNSKSNFMEPQQNQQTAQLTKQKEACSVSLNTPINSVTSATLNASENEKNATNNVQEYQIPVTLYDHVSSAASNDLTKESVTLQYSVTVNNPATGDIQIQSELFPAKPDDSSSKQPIKKRKLMKNTQKERLICNYCSKSFLNKNQFMLHERRHTGAKPFICGVCGQSFAHGNSLSIHMRNHTGEKPFSCTVCGASFTQKSNLGVHLRVHTGEKPFKCDVCESSFSQGSHLIAHKRIHNNERPYVCETCGQAFTQKSALKRHEVKHSALKPYSCITCKTKFNQKEDLNKHIAVHTTNKKDKIANRRYTRKPVKKKNCTKLAEDSSTKTSNCEVSNEDKLKTNGENNDVNDKSQNKKQTSKSSVIKPVKSKPKELIEPVRTSIRLKEAAEKRKYKPKDPDFITGDLDEIDRAEEMENEIAYISTNSKKLKVENLKMESKEAVQSWCFCEVPHGPNEPHTHTEDKLDRTNSQSQEITSNVIVNNDSCREGLLQLALPQLSHTVVLQGDPIALHSQNQNLSNVAHLSVTSDNIIATPSGVEESQVLNSGTSESSAINSQFIGPETVVSSQDVNSHVGSNESKAVYGNAQIISGQVLPNGHFVTQDGAFFIEASDLINSGSGAFVVNAAPGTIFFDIAADGQLLNVPLNASVGHESVLVAGSSCLDANIHSAEVEPIYVTSTDPNVANTLSLSVRDSQANSFLSNPVPSSSTIITNSDMLSSVQSSTVDNSETVNNLSAGTVPYVHVQNSEIGIINPNIAFEQGSSVTTTQNSFVKVKEPIPKIRPVIVNISKCSVCGKEFASKNTLKQHIKSNHPGLHFCTVCFDAFTTKDHLNTHKLQQHKSANSCPECNRYFTTKNALNQHRFKVHNVTTFASKKDIKMFPCTKCKASFSMVSDLNRHVLSHTGVKPFKCKQCGDSFTRKSSLNKHERIHTGEKPYTCKDCGLSFVYKYQINRHKATHESSEQNNFSMPYVYSN